MEQHKIDRINELARKARTAEGLTPAELAERDALRREDIDAHKQSLIRHLEHTYIQYPDGTRKKLPLKQDPSGGKT